MLQPQEKYKAKSVVDTVGYRAGDVSGAFLERLLAGLCPGLLPLTAAVFALATLWLGLSAFLGRTQQRLARAS